MGQKSSSRKRTWLRSLVERLPAPLARNLLFVYAHRQLPHLRHPKTFNQKLNFRVLNDRRPIMTLVSSKIESKIYAESLGIEGLEVPTTLWSGTNLADFNGRSMEVNWVIKPSHRSGLVRAGGPGPVDVSSLEIDTTEWLAEREYRLSKLWGYRNVRREFLVEQRIESQIAGNYPDDIKFFVFDGCVKMIWVDSGRYTSHQTRTCYTPGWEILPYDLGAPRGDRTAPPDNLSKMIKVAEELGAGFDFIRVDLYQEGEAIVFGELTAYPFGGLTPWSRDIDARLGSMWRLPKDSVLKDPQHHLSLSAKLLKRRDE